MFLPLKSPEKLLAESWKLYRSKIKAFTVVSLLGSIAALLFGIALAMFFLWFFSDMPSAPTSFHLANTPIFLVTALALMSIGICISVLLHGALSTLAYTEVSSIREALKKGVHLFPRILAVAILVGIAEFIGFIFFIVPGILFSGWFAFTSAHIARGSDAISAIKKSRRLVVGRWWSSSLRLCIILLIITTVQILNHVLAIPLAVVRIYSPTASIILSGCVGLLLLMFTTLILSPWIFCYKRVLLDNLEETAQI